MKPRYLILIVVLLAAMAGVWGAWEPRPSLEGAVRVGQVPRISPDYAGTVVPPNIAPLNFSVREPGRRFLVRISSEEGEPIDIYSRTAAIVIPARPWKNLLEANRGKPLRIDVYAQADGQWRQYERLTNQIAEEDIDGYVVYRRLSSFFNKYRKTGIYQRDLTTYRESVVVDGMSLDGACVNCHSFSDPGAQRMSVAMRSPKFGNVTLLGTDRGEALRSEVTFGYTAWHPSGRMVVFSRQCPYQFFHTAAAETRDVIDLRSSLGYAFVAETPGQDKPAAASGKMPHAGAESEAPLSSAQVKTVPGASGNERLETFPTWSPDGKYLYYSSAPLLWKAPKKFPPERYAEVQYDLRRIRYDLATDRWGQPETVLAAQKTGFSMLMPRISPDGRFLLCCMCRYGCFPAFQPSSDLYLVDLATREYRRLEANSDTSESWHCWSSNGRWIAFSSKRQAAPLTRCYLSYVDADGKSHKPFVVPQSDPEYYEGLAEMINVPELIKGPLPVRAESLVRAARSSRATGKTGVSESWQQGLHHHH